jgi:tRNA(Phe) wybutosine-synthesizing methylase Tyw3
MEKAERPKIEEKKGWKVSGHTAEEKCRAVFSIWTERRKPTEVCQELGVSVEKEVALSPRLAVLLERKNKGEVMKRLERRLARLCEKNPIKSGGLQEIGV